LGFWTRSRYWTAKGGIWRASLYMGFDVESICSIIGKRKEEQKLLAL
jgi:hypothetical protein